jgi:hypothetical protein
MTRSRGLSLSYEERYAHRTITSLSKQAPSNRRKTEVGARHVIGAAILFVLTYYFREEAAKQLRRMGLL